MAGLSYFIAGGAVFLFLDYLLGSRATISVAVVLYALIVFGYAREQHLRVRIREKVRHRWAEGKRG